MRAVSLCLALLVGGCESSPTEIIVVVTSDLSTPAELDEVVITVTHPDGIRTQTSRAALDGTEPPLPRTLGMAHEGGALGPFLVRVEGRLAGSPVVTRSGQLTFVPDEIRLWRIALERACVGVDCQPETCAAGSCRSLEVSEAELEPYGNGLEDAGTRMDGGPIDSGTDDGGTDDGGTDDGGTGDAGPGDAGAPDAGSCSVCGSGCLCEEGCCDVQCGDLCDSRCEGAGTVCVIDSDGPSLLTGSCVDGAECTVDAREANSVAYTCSGSTTRCEVDCAESSSCNVDCLDGAACTVDCRESSSCELNGCTAGRQSCPGDVEVCGTACR